MVLLINSIAHLVEVPGRLYEFEPGRRELKSPRREIGRDTIVGSAAGVVSISVLCTLCTDCAGFYGFKLFNKSPSKITLNKQTNEIYYKYFDCDFSLFSTLLLLLRFSAAAVFSALFAQYFLI